MERTLPLGHRGLERLLTELRGLGQYTDVVLIDVGATIDVVSRHFWRSADEIVLVTSPDNVAVMDAYASVKSHCDDGKSTRIATLVNQAMDALTAQDAHARLQRACHRFLSVDTRVLGSVPMDAAVRTATVAMRPFLVQAPHGAAALELTRIVGRMIVTPKGTGTPGWHMHGRNRSGPRGGPAVKRFTPRLRTAVSR